MPLSNQEVMVMILMILMILMMIITILMIEVHGDSVVDVELWMIMKVVMRTMLGMVIVQVEELIEAVDVDHDNQLNYSEFVQLFTQQLVL